MSPKRLSVLQLSSARVFPIAVLILGTAVVVTAQTYRYFHPYSGATPSQYVRDAVDLWRDADGCRQRLNKDGFLTPAYGSGDVKVQYHTGMGPDQLCGSRTGNIIHVWEAGGYSGKTVTCDVVVSIAHEIGHVLRLTHSDGGIMTVPEPVEEGGDWVLPMGDITEDNCEEIDLEEGPPDYDNRGRPLEECMPGDWDCETPLIFDLRGDGIRTTSYLEDPVLFDLDGDGNREIVGWTDSRSEDAFLWYDLNRNHRVDGGQEFFGTSMVLPDGSRPANGFEALADYDRPVWGGNGDGVISRDDDIWRSLRLWIDRDHDGVSRPRETMPLARSQIVAIELHYVTLNVADGAGNIHLYAGRFQQRRGNAVIYGKVEDISFLFTEQ